MNFSNDDFVFLCALIKKRSGINLAADKKYLIEARLIPLAQKLGFVDISGLTSEIKLTNNEEVIKEVVEAITTNETSFFRDIKPFDYLKNNILPHITKHLQASGEKEIRIWCAACSSGQEPYSIVMTLLENPDKTQGCSIKIISTDIDRTMIDKAEKGIYTQFEVQRGLPITHLLKYFVKTEPNGEKWQIKENIRKMVKYEFMNLLDSYASIGKFDIIFCRNVMIYFEPALKAEILSKFHLCLKSHGVLFIGGSESIVDAHDLGYKLFHGLRGVYCLA